jgi:ABC-type multidrug transport system fused ATPase/permease subunit
MNNPLIYLIKKMWKYAEFNRPKVVLYVILSIIANIIHSLDPILIGFMMNVIQQEGINQTNLPKIILLLSLFVAAEIVFWMFHGPSRVIENVNAFIVRNNYKKYLLKGVMDLPIEWHTDHHSGDTIDKIEKGTKVLFEFSSITFQIITAVITLITSVAVLFYFDISIGIITVVSVLLVFQIIFFFDKKIIPGYKIVNRLENTTAEKVYDSLSNIVTVIILRIESLVLKTIDTALEKPYNQFKKNHQLNEFKWFLVGAAGRLVVIVSIIGYILIHWHSGTILAGTIYIIYNSSDQLRKTFSSFAYLYSQMVSHRASVANAEELSKDFITNKTATHNHLPTTWNTILIKDLSFSYNTQDDADLHIDTAAMTIKKGERIAVIGESGGGKSTFLKLFRDLYHPKHVELIIDNKKTKENFASIRDSISLIPQDPEIFATTIRENITVGVEYADNIIKQYTDAACFSDVVARLPHGLESSIVEKGVNLSGGEKQRLALVRGLLASQDKEIVLLDEPTRKDEVKLCLMK